MTCHGEESKLNRLRANVGNTDMKEDADEDEDENEDEDEDEDENWMPPLLSSIRKEFTKEKMFSEKTCMEYLNIAGEAFVLGVLPSFYDIYSDIHLGYKYIAGQQFTYYRHVNIVNISDSVSNLSANCFPVAQYTTWIETEMGWSNETVLEYTCLEQDFWFGVTTLLLVMLPALWITPYLSGVLSDNKLSPLSQYIILICLGIPVGFLVPLIIIICKLLSMFNIGSEFGKVLTELSSAEVMCESQLQYSLQLYIIFSRGDRQPTSFQWFGIASSVLFLSLGQIARLNAVRNPVQPEDGLVEKIKRILTYIPFYICYGIPRVVTLALLGVLFSWYGVIAFFVVMNITSWLFVVTQIVRSRGNRDPERSNLIVRSFTRIFSNLTVLNYFGSSKNDRDERKFHMIFWSTFATIVLVTILILCNTTANISIPVLKFDPVGFSFENFYTEHLVWSKIHIIKHLYMLNTIIGSTIGFGVISLVLCYKQLGF